MSGNELSGGDLDRQWYVLEGSDVLGPFSGHVLNDMVRQQTIGPETRVAPVGSRDWQPLGEAGIVVSSPAPAARTRYAGFWIRVGAYLIDAFIVNLCVFVLSFGIFFLLGFVMAMLTGSGDALNGWVARNKLSLNGIGILFWIGYETLFVGGRWQATPGKRICGIYVVQESGARVGYGRALGRYLCYFLDSLILLIGFMMAGWTEEKTALHDLICRTRVLHGRPQPSAQAVAGSF